MEKFIPGMPVGLNELTKKRLALVLQGTGSGPGIHVRFLDFKGNPEEKERELSSFITTVNRYMSNIIQLVIAGDYIVPIIVNHDAVDSKRRSLSAKIIGLSCVLLLFEFVHKHGPTVAALESLLQPMGMSLRELRSLLSELQAMRWIDVIEKGEIKSYLPTDVMKACISPNALVKVYSKLYQLSATQEEKELFLRFLPKEYMRLRRSLQVKKMTQSTLFPGKPEEQEIGSGEEENNNA